MLCGDELRQFVHVECDEFAELEQHCGALGQGDVAPGDSGRLGRSDGRVKSRLAGQPQLCGNGAGGGVVDGLGVGAGACSLKSADEVVDDGHYVDGIASDVIDGASLKTRLQADLSRAVVHHEVEARVH